MQGFVARQLRDFVQRIEFVPFTVTLLDGQVLTVGYPEAITLLSDGFLYHEQDATHRIAPFESVLCLQTMFNPDERLPDDREA